jgi:MFS family permease
VGLPILIAAFVLSSLFAPFVFSGNAWLALVGMVLWGIGMGAQESLLKAVIAGITPTGRRGTAFGVFDTGFGLAWFLGSWGMGVLYAHSLNAVIILFMVLQLTSLPFFLLAGRMRKTEAANTAAC